MGKARAAVLISFSASRAPRSPDSEVTPPDKAAFACGSMPAKRLVSARRYGCKAGKPVQLMSITFPLVTPVMIGSELPLKVHAGVELAAPAGAAASVDSRVRVEANNSKTPRVEAIRWRGIGDSFRGSCGHEWQAFPPPSPAKLWSQRRSADRRCEVYPCFRPPNRPRRERTPRRRRGLAVHRRTRWDAFGPEETVASIRKEDVATLRR